MAARWRAGLDRVALAANLLMKQGMRQPILGSILLVLAFFTGYELREARQEPVPVSSPSVQEAVGSGQAAGRAAESRHSGESRSEAQAGAEKIREQQRRVAELKVRVDASQTALNDLTSKLNPPDASDAGNEGDSEDRLSQARNKLQELQGQRGALHESATAARVEADVRNAQRKMDRELLLADLGSRTQNVQQQLAQLNQRGQQLESMNIETDELQAVRAQVQVLALQQSELQNRVTALKIQGTTEDAAENSLQQQQQQGSPQQLLAASMDQAIRQQESEVQKLEAQGQALQKREAAGQAASELLEERYSRQRNEHEDLVRRYQDAQQVLAGLMGKPVASPRAYE
jgi:chromosome segregation ATPase